jgi:hypothetical protein
MQVYRAIFGIVVAISLVLFLFQAVEGRMGDGRQCYFVGNCEYDDNQAGYRYYQCFGSYASYSHWEQDARCKYPNEKPMSVRKLFGY